MSKAIIHWSVVAMLLVASARGEAQAVVCLDANGSELADCTYVLRSARTLVRLQLQRADGSINNSPAVAVFAGGPNAWINDTVRTNDGVAVATWIGPVSKKATVAASVHQAGMRQEVIITLQPVAAPKLTVERTFISVGGRRVLGSGNYATWYEGRQIRGDPTVRIVGAVTPEACGGAKVHFSASKDGAPGRDTVRGVWQDGMCLASTGWKLGTVIGRQDMRVSAVGNGDQEETFIAHARKVPWLAAGLGIVWRPAIVGRKVVTRTTTIARTENGTTTSQVVTSDTVIAERDRSRTVFRPTLGINSPLFVSAHWLRVSAGVDAQSITDGWFVGASILPVFAKYLYYEDMGVDVQAVLHFDTRERLDDPTGCAADTTRCGGSRGPRFGGAGVMVQMSAAGLLSTLLGAFPK